MMPKNLESYNIEQLLAEADQGGPVTELRYQDLKSAAYIDAIIHFSETLLGIRLKNVKKYRYSSQCPFHADTKESLTVYVNKKDEVRFHCFGACKGDWDIYDVIMLRKKCRFRQAQQVWAEHLSVKDFKSYDGSSPCIPEPDETPEPDVTVGFVEPKKIDERIVAALDDAANFYHDLLMSNEDRFKQIWDYLARRGVEKDTIRKFNIGYSPPYSDDQHQGRVVISGSTERSYWWRASLIILPSTTCFKIRTNRWMMFRHTDTKRKMVYSSIRYDDASIFNLRRCK